MWCLRHVAGPLLVARTRPRAVAASGLRNSALSRCRCCSTSSNPAAVSSDPVDDVVDGEEGPAGVGPGSEAQHAAYAGVYASASRPLDPGLYIIPTPIGNLGDITYRAADTLRRVSLLLAEDTRHTRKLLNFLSIRNLEVLSCHEHNEKMRLERVVQRLQGGEAVGLVSDAGTPGISDPGHQLIRAALDAGVRVVPLPGPCAFVTALVGSGLSTERFTFVGFLPPKSGARKQALQRLAGVEGTLVMYAPPHGLGAVLRDCCEALGGARRCCVARELSKLHEEFYRSTLQGALTEFTEVREPKGEVCLLVEGAEGAAGGRAGAGAEGGAAGGPGGGGGGEPVTVERLLGQLLAEGWSVSSAVKEVVSSLGANRKATYALALQLAEKRPREPESGGEV